MGRRSREQREETRIALMTSAARHFAEHGLEGANINAISVDAGYGKGTVYNYFDSKEALFGAVLEAASEETVRRYRAREPAPEGMRAQLLAIVEEDVELVREYPDVTKVLLREMAAPRDATAEAVTASLAPLAAEVAGILVAGGASRPGVDVVGLTSLFLGLVGALYSSHFGIGWPTWEALPEVAVGLFLDGAGPG